MRVERGAMDRKKPAGATDAPRSARPMDTSSIYIPGAAAGAGEAVDGGAVGRHAGVLSGFCAPRAKMGYPLMFLFTFSGRQTRGPPGSWAEVGFQGVPQTGKIIEVKRRL